MHDTCPGGSTDLDDCNGSSDDYCLGGMVDNDECNSGDPNHFPDGENQSDNCHDCEQDDCTAEGGCSGEDQSGSDGDRCETGLNDTYSVGTLDNPQQTE